jgi:VWFA-related protein
LSVSAQQTERLLFVKVLDQAGAPILDLGPDDFQVEHDGRVRPIVGARLATDPMRIALLVDNSDAAMRSLVHLRSALNAFLDALPAEHEVTLITIARQLGVRVEPTTDRVRLKEAADLVFIDSGSGTVLLDALLETDHRFMENAGGRRPVYVILTTDGSEASQTVGDEEFEAFSAGLVARGVTVHAFLNSTRGGGDQTDIAIHLTESTHGQYEAIAASTGLPDKLRDLAELMTEQQANVATQYRIAFTSDSTNPEAGVRIGVRGAAGMVQVSIGQPLP